MQVSVMNDITINTNALVTLETINFSKYLKEFIAEQDIKENSKGTYRRAVNQFFSFMSNKSIELTGNEILEY